MYVCFFRNNFFSDNFFKFYRAEKKVTILAYEETISYSFGQPKSLGSDVRALVRTLMTQGIMRSSEGYLAMNKLIRQNFGRGVTFKIFLSWAFRSRFC